MDAYEWSMYNIRIENWDVTSGGDLNDPSPSMVVAKSYL
jgi:hypothetical protein